MTDTKQAGMERSGISPQSALKEAVERVIVLEAENEALTKALTGLTCGGSEFFSRKGDRYVADIAACVAWVRRNKTEAHRRTVDALLENKRQAESLEAMASALAERKWSDKEDELTPAIMAAHPTMIPHETREPWCWDVYNAAMNAVSNRHGKYELVNLVNWLMVRVRTAEEALTQYRKTGDL